MVPYSLAPTLASTAGPLSCARAMFPPPAGPHVTAPIQRVRLPSLHGASAVRGLHPSQQPRSIIIFAKGGGGHRLPKRGRALAGGQLRKMRGLHPSQQLRSTIISATRGAQVAEEGPRAGGGPAQEDAAPAPAVCSTPSSSPVTVFSLTPAALLRSLARLAPALTPELAPTAATAVVPMAVVLTSIAPVAQPAALRPPVSGV